MKKKHPQWIDEYAEAFYSSFQQHDVRAHMPFSGWDFYPLFADLLVRKVHEAILALEQKGLTAADVIENLPNHASMKFKFPELILSLKSANAEPEVAKKVSDFFVEAIRARADGKELWLNNKLRMHDGVRLAQEKKFVPGNREHASEIGKIITGCATLAHGLYNDFCPDTSYDVYGPYDVSDAYGEGSTLIIRSFADLAPREVWPDKKLPYKRITVYTVYRGLSMRPTFVPCQMVLEQNPHDHFTHYQVEIDGRFVIDIDELKKIRETILKLGSELYVEYQSLGFEKHKELWLWQHGYQLKGLFDAARMDWKPSQEMLGRVKGKELIPTIATYQMPRKEFYEKFGIEYLKQSYRV